MKPFLNWREAYEAGPAVCGGKGYNLARLDRYGFRVPRGGVLIAGAPLDAIPEWTGKVAVRSSATGEDSARASFAGIHRSFLNVSGAHAIQQAAQGCLDSLQTPEAIAYRRRMGFGDDEVRCAVVICEMVDARCAGVAFSCDPATGRRDLTVIDAAEGLGEAVVSGRVNPHRIVWRNRDGLWAREEGRFALLPDAAEEELAYLVQRVHWALGEGQDPQDVEWAFDGKRLWLLQARPVTQLMRAGYAETAAMPRYWSTANIKDAVPGVICELSWSGLRDAVEGIAFAAQESAGYQLPPGVELVRRFEGRGYFDLTFIQWAMYDSFGVIPADVVRLLGGNQPEIPAPPHPLSGAAGSRRKRRGLRLFRTIWNYPAKARPLIEAHLQFHRSLDGIDWSTKSLAELRQTLTEIAGREVAYRRVAGLANSCGGPWHLALDAITKDTALVGRLQTGAGGVSSAELGYRILEIAQGKATVEEFLREFGHRTVYEADLLNPRWAEDPSWILEQVQFLRDHPAPRDPRETAAAARRQAEEELRRRFPLRAPILMWLVRKMRAGMATRESAKSALVCDLLPLRRIVLEIGRRMVSAGLLDTQEQALHFAWADIACWLCGYWNGSGARELATDRSRRRQAWLRESPPDLIVEEPDGRIAAPVAEASMGADGWSGIAVSSGCVTGVARIVMLPTEGAHLQQGEILVAPSTDPGWTPLFLRASAIVMETGGYLSHGAIVAREYGIPAVANVPGILKALRDGEQITVNGSTGQVQRA